MIDQLLDFGTPVTGRSSGPPGASEATCVEGSHRRFVLFLLFLCFSLRVCFFSFFFSLRVFFLFLSFCFFFSFFLLFFFSGVCRGSMSILSRNPSFEKTSINPVKTDPVFERNNG